MFTRKWSLLCAIILKKCLLTRETRFGRTSLSSSSGSRNTKRLGTSLMCETGWRSTKWCSSSSVLAPCLCSKCLMPYLNSVASWSTDSFLTVCTNSSRSAWPKESSVNPHLTRSETITKSWALNCFLTSLLESILTILSAIFARET